MSLLKFISSSFFKLLEPIAAEVNIPCKVASELYDVVDPDCTCTPVEENGVHVSNVASLPAESLIPYQNFQTTVTDNTVTTAIGEPFHVQTTFNEHGKEVDNFNSDTKKDVSEEREFNNINEAFDAHFEEIVSILSDEAKLRDSDLLADENESNATYDPEIAEHLGTVVVNDNITCVEKEKEQVDDPCAKPLYAESPHTLGVTILLISCFLIRFRLPDEALTYMLRLIACILPHGHRLMGSLYHFKNMMKQYSSDLLPTIIYHCNNCYSSIEKSSKTCPSCGKSLTRTGAVAYFLQLKIVSQLASLWKNSEFCDMVRNHRFQHIEKYKGRRLADIYDGILYQKLFRDNGVLSNANNISFSLNTDGAPLFKSSNISVWPVYLLINELPIAHRKKRMNSLFYGVWISSSKPQMWSFLKPLFEELKLLESDGHLFTDYFGEVFNCKCVLLTCTCDLPARALVYNCLQFNGDNSCWHCLQRGETYKHETGGISHNFQYDEHDPKGPPRTKESVNLDVDKVMDNVRRNVTQSSVNGHKGRFWFMYLETFDYINSCIIDYMHGVCLGVVKTLLTIWFDKKNKDKNSSFFSKRGLVNCVLQEIKPTIFVSRIPRALDEISHWKSSEYRNFLLYWGIPILRYVLDMELYTHFCLLARSIFLLSKEGVTFDELQAAESALLLFVEHFQILYGERYMTLNVHQLVHLTDCVRHTGPLYVNNCFIFEDLNGYIVKQIHGTQGVDTQLTNIISMLRVPSRMYTLYLKDTTNQEAIDLYNELSDSVTARYKHLDEIEDGIRPLGSATWKQLSDDEKKMALSHGIKNDEVKEFYRVNMYKKGFYVYGKAYSRLDKRQQNVISYLRSEKIEFASVISFIQSEERHPNVTINIAIVKPFKKLQPLGCVWEVSPEDTFEFIPIHNIINVNNFVQIKNACYVCPSPNRYDRD